MKLKLKNEKCYENTQIKVQMAMFAIKSMLYHDILPQGMNPGFGENKSEIRFPLVH